MLLDEKPLKTPAKAGLVLPTLQLARKIAQEWDSQTDKIDPEKMPFTRTANSAIDKISSKTAEVAEMLIAYGDADLICYRAESPVELVKRQKDAWDPVLDWADKEFGARLMTRKGIMHVAQSGCAIDRLGSEVNAFSVFELAGFHDLVALSGSLVLALAAAHQLYPPTVVWKLSRIDEDWQKEQWGEDEEESVRDTIKLESFISAESFFRLSQKKA